MPVGGADANGLMHSRKDSSSYSSSPLAGTCSPVFHGALIHAVQEQKHTLRQVFLSANLLSICASPSLSPPSALCSIVYLLTQHTLLSCCACIHSCSQSVSSWAVAAIMLWSWASCQTAAGMAVAKMVHVETNCKTWTVTQMHVGQGVPAQGP